MLVYHVQGPGLPPSAAERINNTGYGRSCASYVCKYVHTGICTLVCMGVLELVPKGTEA